MADIRIRPATVSDCESEHNLFNAEHSGNCTFGEMSSQRFDELRESIKVRYSRRLARSSVLAIAAARKCLDGHDVEPQRLGVITTGGPLHLSNAWRLTSTVLFDDTDLVDPLAFPQSIVSSVPCSVAAAVNAQAFAFAIGYNESAFCEALVNSHRLLTAGFADSIALVTAVDTDIILKDVIQNAGGGVSLTGAVCFLLTRLSVDEPHVIVLDTNRCCDQGKDPSEYVFTHHRWLGEEPLLAGQCGFELYESLYRARDRSESHTPFRVSWSFANNAVHFDLMWAERG